MIETYCNIKIIISNKHNIYIHSYVFLLYDAIHKPEYLSSHYTHIHIRKKKIYSIPYI